MTLSQAAEILFQQAGSKNILVVGDLMADHYVWGSSDRISPEAPVPVVDVEREETRAGGAANVGINLRAFGTRVSLCGLCGADDTGDDLEEILRNEGFHTQWVLREKGRVTTRKSRIIANGKHMLRLDREDRHSMEEESRNQLLEEIGKHISEFDAVILEDYNKGALDPPFIRQLIGLANANRIPVIVDPKFRNFFSYEACTVFKPNLKELNEALEIHLDGSDVPALENALKSLHNKMPHGNSLVTLGEKGMLGWNEQGKSFHIPGEKIVVKDVSGAGDTVAAMLGLCLACGLDFETSARIANLSGAMVCESVGVVAVNAGELKKKLGA